MIAKSTREDKQRENCCFFTVKINGWPHVFVITTKNIAKNHELLMDYGEGYSQIFGDKARYERILNFRKCISDNIKNNIVDLPLNDCYRLE